MNFETIHHGDGEFCPNCEAKLKQVHSDLVKWYRTKKSKYQNLHISWGFRNCDDQTTMFEQGKSKEQWPNSKHNNQVDNKPYSLALDLFQIDEDGVARFSKDFYKLLASECKKNKDPITWGGDFTSFIGDFNHFQLN